MENWHSIELGDGMFAVTPLDDIREAFQHMFVEAGKPVSMAVFTRYESEGRLHCNVIAYFSPAAKTLAQAFDAQPCGKPARAELGLLAGDVRAWSALFPEDIETAI